jgi:hypothetical protein
MQSPQPLHLLLSKVTFAIVFSISQQTDIFLPTPLAAGKNVGIYLLLVAAKAAFLVS